MIAPPIDRPSTTDPPEERLARALDELASGLRTPQPMPQEGAP